jgi:hypothetical protein
MKIHVTYLSKANVTLGTKEFDLGDEWGRSDFLGFVGDAARRGWVLEITQAEED